MTECLDEATLLSFGQGTMPAADRPACEAHIAECDECRALVSAVRRSSLVDPEEAAGVAAPPIVVAAPLAAPTSVAAVAGVAADLPVRRSHRRLFVLLAAAVAALLVLVIMRSLGTASAPTREPARATD